MDVALRTAEMSYAKRLKVGSVIVVDNSIVSTGFNGMPKGFDNNCEHMVNGELVTNKEVIHSEQNAIDRATERKINLVGGTIFQSHCPCIPCSMSIFKSGIDTVYYNADYRNKDGVIYLQDNGVEVIKVS